MPDAKICFIIPGFGIGGAQKQCIYLLNELQKDPQLQISLIYFYEDVNFDLLNQSNISLFKLSATSFYNPLNIFKILKVVKQIKPDVLFTWLQAPDVYAFFIKILYPKIKWVIAERNAQFPTDIRFKARSATGKFADLIIANSLQGKNYWLRKHVKPDKLLVIHNVAFLSSALPTNQMWGSPIILFAGRFEDQKNVVVLTEAFCKMANDYPEARFYLIGEGALKGDIEAIIEKYKKGSQVIIMPFKKDIIAYFVKADVFVNISLYEGMPNTVIENVNLKKRIIVSNIKEHADLLGESYPFYVNNLNDPEEVKLKIEESLAVIDTTAILKHASKIVESMTPENIAEAYKKAFLKVIANT